MLFSDSQTERGTESPTHHQCVLPANGATVSLFRIRQGRHLHKALRLTYATTLCAFLCSVLQLYSMFGVYGVLSHKPHPDPWQWLIFKSIFRSDFICGSLFLWWPSWFPLVHNQYWCPGMFEGFYKGTSYMSVLLENITINTCLK